MENKNIIPFFGLQRQYAQLRNELLDASDCVYRSGQVLDGENTNKFSRAIARRCDREFAIPVNSCTQALLFVLMLKGRYGRVLIPNISFAATVNSVLMANCQPDFVDVDFKGLIDLKSVGYHPGNTGIDTLMYVNLFGNTVDYDQFRIIAKFFNKDMFVIEDAAQSFGARYKDIPSGKLGDVSVLSFDPTKNLPNYGSGGMILTDDFNLAEELLNLRDNGKISGHEQVGTNSKMSESDCAQMLVKLKYFDSWQERRNKIADYYIEHMYPYVDVLLPNEHVTHAWHKFVLRVNDRNRVQHHMTISGIETKVHYPVPLDVMGVAKNQSSEELHQSHHFSREVLSLPIYPELTDSEVERITDSVTNYYKNY